MLHKNGDETKNYEQTHNRWTVSIVSVQCLDNTYAILKDTAMETSY